MFVGEEVVDVWHLVELVERAILQCDQISHWSRAWQAAVSIEIADFTAHEGRLWGERACPSPGTLFLRAFSVLLSSRWFIREALATHRNMVNERPMSLE